MADSQVGLFLSSMGVTRQDCNPSATVAFQSMNEFGVERKSCATHGARCPTADNANYIMIVQDQDDNKRQWVIEMTGEQLPAHFLIKRSAEIEYDTFTASLFTCKPLNGGIGLNVISSTSASNPTMHSDSATGIESKLSRMTLRYSLACDMSVTVTRPTYWKASVQWSINRSGCVLPFHLDRWLITLTRRFRFGVPAICYFFADAQQMELDFPLALTAKAEYTVNVKALQKSHSDANIYFVLSEDNKVFIAGKQVGLFRMVKLTYNFII
jgi:hypothetical protein